MQTRILLHPTATDRFEVARKVIEILHGIPNVSDRDHFVIIVVAGGGGGRSVMSTHVVVLAVGIMIFVVVVTRGMMMYDDNMTVMS